MRKIKNIIIITLSLLLGTPIVLSIILSVIGLYLYCTADFLQPNINVDTSHYQLTTQTDSIKLCDYGSLYLNKYGLWKQNYMVILLTEELLMV